MPMADGRTQLRKIAFQVGSRFFRFAINPENLQKRHPHRTTATKTKSRIVVEDFQDDIPVFTIGGTTGFNPTGVNRDRGIEKIKELKRFLEDYAAMGGNGAQPAQDFYFHDFTNDESYIVHLNAEGVTYMQDVNSPLTHKYNIVFVVLRKAGQPSEDSIVDPEIGNRFPSIPRPDGGIPSWRPNPLPDFGQTRPPSGGGGYSPDDDVYGDGGYNNYRPPMFGSPINPQSPSPTSYELGRTGLGYMIGYYGRSY